MKELRDAVLTPDTGTTLRALAQRWVEAEDWPALLAARDAAREELDGGDRRWGFADYYLTGELCFAPPEFAVHALAAHRLDVFERVAQTHTWAEMQPHLVDRETALLLAYHSVARGEDLTLVRGLDTSRIGLPLRLEEWEPHYVFRNYGRSGGSAGPMTGGRATPFVDLPPAGERVEGDLVTESLLAFPRGWVEQSCGESAAVCVRGTAAEAISSLGRTRAGIRPVTGQAALEQLALACATGGAYGGGQGVIRARVAVSNLMAAMNGDAWGPPYRTESLAKRATDVAWFTFEPQLDELEYYIWELYVAAEEVAGPHAWALAATDND